MTNLPNIRAYLENREREWLSPFAALSAETRGRDRSEEPSNVRTEFQRDRDRIIHAKAFRRLKHKTQVFIAPSGDHYVTRLTHTIEVSQLARTITRALHLNEDLAEAISLGHDLGHTPFGHVGEEVLAELYPGGFRHNVQSLRVVEKLENGGQGLNLTFEVRDGILNHSKGHGDIMSSAAGVPSTLEGEVCRLADALAYINHDIGDAVRAGIIKQSDLPRAAVEVLGETQSKMVDTMVCDVIAFSYGVSGQLPGHPAIIGMSQPVLRACNQMRDFLFERVYQSRDRNAEKVRAVLRNLYNFYLESHQSLPKEFHDPNDPARGVVDYIAGMTDQFATEMAHSHGLD